MALVGGTVYVSPTDEPIHDGVVLIDGETIVAVGGPQDLELPRSVRALDCSGLTIMAGFWNNHVHLFERKWADAASIPAEELGRQLQDMFTRYGFTSVFDLSSKWENTRQIRRRIESGEIPGPQIRSTGEGLVPPDALPSEQALNIMGIMPTDLPVITDDPEAIAAVSKLLKDRVDAIKLFLSSPRGPSLSQRTIAAAVQQAHQQGRLVFAHPNSAADVLRAVQNGVDIIAHTTPASGPWDESLLRTMKAREIALIPTLQLWSYQRRHDRLSDQEQLIRTAVDQLRAWLATGGTVLFGTDVGAVEYDPADEFELMADAEMSVQQILASLTTAPARRFGDEARLGKIAPGFQADVVVLKENPATSIRAFADVQYTLRAGKIIYHAED